LELHGNTAGLGPSERNALERLYRRRTPPDTLTTPELTRSLCDVSRATRRQVGVLIDRAGQVQFVVIGDSAKLMLPDLGRSRAGSGRFRGLRLLHTHLRGEPLTRDDLVDLTRLRLDMIAALAVTPEGQPQQISYAHCVPVPDGSTAEPFRVHGPFPYARLDCNPEAITRALEEEFARAARLRKVVAKDGRAILVQVAKKRDSEQAAAALRELKELARTAGVEVCDTVVQMRDTPDPKYVLGRGRLEETVLRAMQLDVEVLIFDRELSPNQAAAIAQLTDLKVLDRTQLILDIFAQHAQSVDGKLQVELAQIRYLLPRLGLRDDALSRLTGGIGGRGPGETKLEIGRRRARERVSTLEERLKHSARHREQRRARRDRRGVPVTAIVGYTNAGKSTLLNALTGSEVLAENKLFATLDPRTRRMWLDEREVVLTDTVGFIRDLPEDLLRAFRATFEEASDADLLLHVVDAADPAHEEQLATTHALLRELDLADLPRLLVLSKCDLIPLEHARNLAERYQALPLSAARPDDIAALRAELALRLRELVPKRQAEPVEPEQPGESATWPPA
jgi:GTP-binding protein HflX